MRVQFKTYEGGTPRAALEKLCLWARGNGLNPCAIIGVPVIDLDAETIHCTVRDALPEDGPLDESWTKDQPWLAGFVFPYGPKRDVVMPLITRLDASLTEPA